MGPRCVLVGGQDPDLPPGHLLFMDVHRLKVTGRDRREDVMEPQAHGGSAGDLR